MSDLTGKTAIITGAASGIGAATARIMHARGANIVGADLDRTGLQNLEAELGNRFAACAGDISLPEQLRSILEMSLARFGAPHIAVLNAGIDGPMANILDIGSDQFDQVLSVNVKAPFLAIQTFAPAMKESGGAFVLTSSINGLRAFANTSPYTTSKMAVLGLTRAAANDLAQFRIRVNAVHPGLIDTPMLKRAENGLAPGHAGELRAALSQTVALKRVGQPEEIARTIAFLASDEASYISGESIVVDGGMTRLLSM